MMLLPLARGPDVDLPLQDLKADDVIFDAIKQGNDLAPLLNPAYKKNTRDYKL